MDKPGTPAQQGIINSLVHSQYNNTLLSLTSNDMLVGIAAAILLAGPKN